MNNPFIFYEMDFDSEMFKKYYGSIENPGIYAIPEDEVEPNSAEEQPENTPEVVNPDESETEQNITDKEKIVDYLTQTQGLPEPQLNQDEQAAYNSEVEPIKKIYLLNKLSQLSYLLKNKFSVNTDLDLVLKFGTNLSYRTLQILTINIINHLRDLAQAEEQQPEGSGENNVQTQEQQV